MHGSHKLAFRGFTTPVPCSTIRVHKEGANGLTKAPCAAYGFGGVTIEHKRTDSPHAPTLRQVPVQAGEGADGGQSLPSVQGEWLPDI